MSRQRAAAASAAPPQTQVPPAVLLRGGGLWWLAIWALLVGVALATRPLTPVDESRYVSVAWEMWQRGDFLVPWLNGAPYSHKPPLLFWLMQLGWWAFGVNEWWPRLVAPLFGLASLFLCAALARRLWPRREGPAALAPLVLLGTLLWATFSTLTMFDMLVAFFAQAAILGFVEAWHSGHPRGWLWAGVAMGLGILAKGPVVFVYTLPVALLAPWWGRGGVPGGWGRWYAGAALSVVLAGALGLAWALPAAAAGGPAYGEALLWKQTAGRVVESFAHRRAWWWYLAVLPAALFPWSLWTPLWAALRRAAADAGLRLCAAWGLSSLLLLSLVSGKQLHYLLPLLPALALAAARAVCDPRAAAAARRPAWLPGLAFAGLGGTLLLLPAIGAAQQWPAWTRETHLAGALAVLAAGLALCLLPRRPPARALPLLGAASVAFFVVFHLSVVPAAAPYWRLGEIAAHIAAVQTRGGPVAYLGDYHGEYNFLGRLSRPLAEIEPHQVDAWAAAHPHGLVVTDDPACGASAADVPLYAQPLRGGTVTLWPSAVLRRHPGLLARPCASPAASGPAPAPSADSPVNLTRR